MTVVNQLLAKAMSAASEEEAISCLRMARKKGNSFSIETQSQDFKGQNAKYWYNQANLYYQVSLKLEADRILQKKKSKQLPGFISGIFVATVFAVIFL